MAVEESEIHEEFIFKEQILGGSPIPLTLVIASYLIFTTKLGPYLMKNRSAYNLQHVLLVYNAVQVVTSCWITVMAARLLSNHGLFDTRCDSTRKPFIYHIQYTGYCYFLTKVSELLDTVFFVLRKKQNQVTFLHLYHHTMVVCLVWRSMRSENPYYAVFLTTLNSFVHVVMYSYYGLAAIPAIRPYLWWKKYITKLQLIQFGLILLHIIVFSIISECPPFYSTYGIMIANVIFLIFLFSKFYLNTYLS